ncbi:MAG: hypothetical protein WBQ08_16045 [Candidatus Sulfotelmatobacter sp.]
MRIFCTAMMLLGISYSCVAQTRVINYQIFEVKLEKEILKSETTGPAAFTLPQFRVYNRKGQEMVDLGGFLVSEDFKQQLQAALKLSSPTNSGRTLNWEVDRIANIAGPRLPDLDPPGVKALRVRGGELKSLMDATNADFTFVEYWAESCKPCELQRALMMEILNSHPELHFNILHVEADPAKSSTESAQG